MAELLTLQKMHPSMHFHWNFLPSVTLPLLISNITTRYIENNTHQYPHLRIIKGFRTQAGTHSQLARVCLHWAMPAGPAPWLGYKRVSSLSSSPPLAQHPPVTLRSWSTQAQLNVKGCASASNTPPLAIPWFPLFIQASADWQAQEHLSWLPSPLAGPPDVPQCILVFRIKATWQAADQRRAGWPSHLLEWRK